jgi:hypothetical protein
MCNTKLGHDSNLGHLQNQAVTMVNAVAATPMTDWPNDPYAPTASL